MDPLQTPCEAASVDSAVRVPPSLAHRSSVESEVKPFPTFSYVSNAPTTTTGTSGPTGASGGSSIQQAMASTELRQVGHDAFGGVPLSGGGGEVPLSVPPPYPNDAVILPVIPMPPKSGSPDVIPFLTVPSSTELEMLLMGQGNASSNPVLLPPPAASLPRGDSNSALMQSESRKSSRMHRSTSTRKHRFDSSKGTNREGCVRRAADEKSATFAFPALSLTSPPAGSLDHIPMADESIGSPPSALAAGLPPPLDLVGPASRPQPRGNYFPSNSFPTKPPLPRSNLVEVLTALDSITLDATVNHAIQPWAIFCLFGSLERRIQLRDFTDSFRRHTDHLDGFLTKVLQIDNVFPPDFNLLHFLRNPSQAPSEEFFEFPMVSWPLTTLFLVASFFVTAKRVGYERLFKALQLGGILTVGKGVFAALAVAESHNEEELIRSCSKHYRAAFCVGIAYQEKQLQVSELTAQCHNKGFSMLIVNIPISTLKLLIEQVNVVDSTTHNNETPFSQVHISRIISQRTAVAVGHPLDLMRLDILIVKFVHQSGVKIHRDFLPTPVPENSTFYNQGLRHSVVHLWMDMEYTIDGKDLVIPCFSPEDGTELGTSGDLTMEMAGAVTCVPQDLTYSLQNLRDGDVLLDFSVSTMRIGQMIAWTRRNILCLCQPTDRVEESILPSPRRSAQGSLILATLGKIATINEIFASSFTWDGKPADARISQLSTSFLDLKLLIDLDNTQTPILSPTQSTMELRSEMSITSFPMNVHRPSAMNVSGMHLESPGASSVQSPKTSRLFGASLGLPPAMVGQRSPAVGGTVLRGGLTSHESRLITVGSSVNRQVVNVYEVSPMIQYLELQHRCVLTRGAVEFADRLSRVTKIDFPSHTLLLCPTVFQLLEYWDGLEFTLKLKEDTDTRRQEREATRDAPPGVIGAATRRRAALRRTAELLYLGPALSTQQASSSLSPRQMKSSK